MKDILIAAGAVQMEAELRDTPSGEAIWDALPLQGRVNRWGDEIYFSTGLDLDLENDATDTMPSGSLAYWPPGKGFCILFGATPASGADGTPRLASESNPIGKVHGDPAELKSVSSGEKISVTRK